MGFPMTGAGLWTGEGGLLFTERRTFAGLWGLGSTTGGGISLFWGRPTLMLNVVLALAGAVVRTTAGSTGAALTGATAGLTASGAAGLAAGGAGDEAGAGAGARAGAGAGAGAGDAAGAGGEAEAEEGMSVSVVDLLGAGFMGGTFTDDIMTTGAGGAVAGAVLTTTEAVDLSGSMDEQRRNIHKKKGLM